MIVGIGVLLYLRPVSECDVLCFLQVHRGNAEWAASLLFRVFFLKESGIVLCGYDPQNQPALRVLILGVNNIRMAN